MMRGGRGWYVEPITEAGDFITEDVDNYFEIKDEIKDYQVDDDDDEKEDDDDEKEEDVLNQLLRPVTIAPPSWHQHALTRTLLETNVFHKVIVIIIIITRPINLSSSSSSTKCF